MITPDNYAEKPYEQTPGILPQTERDKVYAAANTIRDYCQHNDCKNGCWFADKFQRCRLQRVPGNWAELRARRWTEAEITMAKSLRMMGYTAIRTYRNVYDDRQVVVEKISDDGVHETVTLPKRSFANTKYGETYILEDIIREYEEDYGR